MTARMHQFHAVAFEENLSLRQLAPIFPQARITAHELYVPIDAGAMYVYPFGAVVTHDIEGERRAAEMARLRTQVPRLTTKVVVEDYTEVAISLTRLR